MSGSMKGRYYRLPNLIHIAPVAELASPEQRDSARGAAVAEWTRLLAKLEEPKSKSGISKEALLQLRDEDLSFFNGSTAAVADAGATPAPSAGQP
jgi:hypothetical protein